jgi:hypothetical protein
MPGQPMKAAVVRGTTQGALCIYYMVENDFVFIEHASFRKGCVTVGHI